MYVFCCYLLNLFIVTFNRWFDWKSYYSIQDFVDYLYKS